MRTFRSVLLPLLGLAAIAAPPAQAQTACKDLLCGLPLHTPSAGPSPTDMAQQQIDQINRVTEQRMRMTNEAFNGLSRWAQMWLSTRNNQSSGGATSGGSSFDSGNGASAASGYDQAQQRLEIQQQEADAALDESCRLLIAAAAQSGKTVDLAGNNACSRPIDAYLDRTTRYSSGGRAAPPGGPIEEPVIDGSDIPRVIDFPQGSSPASQSSAALEELVQEIVDQADIDSVGGTSLDQLVFSIAGASSGGTAQQPKPDVK